MDKDKKIISIKNIKEIKKRNVEQHVKARDQAVMLRNEVASLKSQLAGLEARKEALLEDLRTAIDKEKSQWQEEKEAEEEQARQLGYKIGYDAGLEEALTEHKAILNEANHIVDLAKKDYIQTIEKHKEAIVSLAIKTAETIIDKQLQVDPNNIMSIVAGGINELLDQSNIKINLHPSDFEFVFRHKEELERLVQDDDLISIYANDELNQGDCIIEHQFGEIDVSVDVQLEQIKKALEQKITEN